VFFRIQDDGKSPEKFCESCTTYTIVRILSSLSCRDTQYIVKITWPPPKLVIMAYLNCRVVLEAAPVTLSTCADEEGTQQRWTHQKEAVTETSSF
jgi:hypothetical protein